jgi:hypothetical protein
MLSSSNGKKGEDARPPARSRAVRKKLLLALLGAAPLFPLRRLPREAEQRSCIDYQFINWKQIDCFAFPGPFCASLLARKVLQQHSRLVLPFVTVPRGVVLLGPCTIAK